MLSIYDYGYYLSRVLLFSVPVFVTYILFLSIYRIFFHPLAKYPGPFLAKLTDSHSTYHAYHGTRHLEFYRMHQKYGPIVRYGPNHVSINSASALKTIYGHKSNVKKSMFYSVFPPTKHTFNTHSSIDKAAHARKRRVLSHAFSEGAVRSMERYVTGNIRTFCEKLGGKSDEGVIVLAEKQESKGWSKPQNMADWCNYLTFDVMGDLCFGKAFEMLERPENRHVIDLIGNAAHMHLILGTNPLLKKLNLHRLLFPDILKARTQYMQYSKGQAQERTKLGLDTDRKDFFYYLLNAKDTETGGPGFNTQELWGESNLLIIAGSDTTSTALASSFFYLVHNPSKLEALQKEVRAVFSDVEEIHSGPELNTCVYLRAVIDESMRLSPPVGGILPREVLQGGLTIDNHHFPAGVVVGTPHYTIHHNEDYYPDPFTFSPERWLADYVGKENVSTANSAFCPFSIGPRGCIGKGLAYAELTTALARVVFMYDFKLANGVDVGNGNAANKEWGRQRVGEYQLKDCFTSMKEGPMVLFKERSS